MFAETVLVYPAVLALLSLGVGLGIDRISGSFLPAMLLVAVGVAGLIALAQLVTYVPALTPGTPYAMAVLAAAGLLAGWQRIRGGVSEWREHAWGVAAGAVTYVIALAPVIAAGRPSLSSYMALTDSAVHILGADYILQHGQSFAHLDLNSSAGVYVNNYYRHAYPSGADTLFGASAMLVRASLLFAYQPFCAFMLAVAAGPAWLLARRIGLNGAWAALAAITACVPALVYGYELVGEVKELVTLPELMALGALVVVHDRWLRGPPRGMVAFGLVVAAGVSTIGVAFGAWAAATGLVLVALAVLAVGRGKVWAQHVWASAATVIALVLVGAWPTWSRLPGSVEVARAIATTANPGNLQRQLPIVRALGIWLSGNYVVAPTGVALSVTYAFVAVALMAFAIGAWHVVRTDRTLAWWIALMLCVWLVLTASGTTWTDAKTLMLTSPIVVLVSWAGVAALRARAWLGVAVMLAAALVAGVLASDAVQYHTSNLAPTARYQELAAVGRRFAGKGPALFTDYDEYAMYELRDLEVGGPNFIYPPPALAGVVPSHGYPVEVDRIAAAKLAAYPLIITRRNPRAARPPAAYSLTWQGTYYQVWARRRSARLPVAGTSAPIDGTLSCQSIAAVAAAAAAAQARGRSQAGDGARAGAGPRPGLSLAAAIAPELVKLPLARLHHTRRWTRGRIGLLLNGPGSLHGSFTVPHPGVWDVWIEGQLMPEVHIGLDGHRIGSIAGQVGGTSLTQQVMTPLSVKLAAGAHRLAIQRDASGLAPGEGGWADIRAIYLTPAGAGSMAQLVRVPAAHWRSLCSRRLEWVEALPRRSAA